jgi:hypothetical protein
VVLLLVLLAGVVTALLSISAPWRQEQDLTGDLAAGRVTHLEYDQRTHDVRWVDGWWRWRQTTLVSWTNGRDPAQSQGDGALEWLGQQIHASGHPVEITFLGNQNQRSWWPERVASKPLRLAAGAAWVLTFLMMISRSRHRYANRWAWFWLFTLGQGGVLLYLLLEPQPVWRPASWPPRDRPPVKGGMGFLYAIVLSFAVGGAGLALSAVVR